MKLKFLNPILFSQKTDHYDVHCLCDLQVTETTQVYPLNLLSQYQGLDIHTKTHQYENTVYHTNILKSRNVILFGIFTI